MSVSGTLLLRPWIGFTHSTVQNEEKGETTFFACCYVDSSTTQSRHRNATLNVLVRRVLKQTALVSANTRPFPPDPVSPTTPNLHFLSTLVPPVRPMLPHQGIGQLGKRSNKLPPKHLLLRTFDLYPNQLRPLVRLPRCSVVIANSPSHRLSLGRTFSIKLGHATPRSHISQCSPLSYSPTFHLSHR